MAYRLGEFELDPGRFELRRAGSAVAVEPQVLSILLLLVDHRDRLVTKDEIIETIWKGRIVSDSAIASRIKSARHALLDDGHQQRMIRTIHGMGFRFVGPVESLPIPVRFDGPPFRTGRRSPPSRNRTGRRSPSCRSDSPGTPGSMP
ncbi:MAG TPA: winged helix-turn-helix domain-containing protein [Sphingomonas sp.]|nr:winged helix-turn-helix domain-containing protein [Sphingomonas sp.]